MRSELDVLLDKVADPTLRANIRSQVDRLRAKRTFGLVFESHLPERVRLPEHEIRAGVRVAYRDDPASAAFEVIAIKKKTATLRKVRNPDGSALSPAQGVEVVDETARLDAVVVIADFGEPVFPGLRHLGSVSRGGNKPAHVVIKGENHHVLEALHFTHAGKVDCIYIDPPYNSGARDWKYDNNYVDDADNYRHSKWLAMMERRLLLAKELLNPNDSVLIVTIDEKEYLRLGLLLEQTFPQALIQMISANVNPANVARKGAFGRSDEYVFFVMIGSAAPQRIVLGADWVSTRGRTFTGSVRWDLLRRSGTNAKRADRPKLFYPIYVDTATAAAVGTGDPLKAGGNLKRVIAPPGQAIVWPIRKDGSQGNWQLGPKALMQHVQQGRVRLGGTAEKGYVVYYIKGGEYQKILRGDYPVLGRKADGSLDLSSSDEVVNLAVPGTQWRVSAHDATQYGSRLLSSFLPGRSFPFPKSLYAVEDALRQQA